LLAGVLFLCGAALVAQPEEKPSVTVDLYLSTDCPVAARYGPRLAAIVSDYQNQGFEIRAWFPNEGETKHGAKQWLAERKIPLEPSLDWGGEQAARDEVEIIPTVVVRDAEGNRLYHGAIDDNRVDERAKTPYLRNALAALAKGEPVAEEAGEPFGCFVMPGDPLPPAGQITYADHAAAIINENCVSCHRPGEVAPFSLVGYENARKWHRMIAWTTEERLMPPWPAEPGYGKFRGELALSDREIEVLKRWAEAGAPMGEEANLPPEPEFGDSTWAMGEPDMLLRVPYQHEIAADGRDEYWHFILQPEIDEPVVVKAMDVHPGNKRVVHHVIGFIDSTGASLNNVPDRENGPLAYERFGGPGFIPSNSLGGWAPGMRPQAFPEGAGIVVNPGDRLVLQVHYTKTGRPETDQTEVGLYLADPDEEITDELRVAWLAHLGLRIPAGEPEVEVERTFNVPAGFKVFAVMPHMHLLGQHMEAAVETEGGETIPLVRVPDWSFKWQFAYVFEEPIVLDEPGQIRLKAVYDNSAGNPDNPHDPPREVRWGENTTDEMMLLVVFYSRE
jgi:mono/diheme cytochrome c family protein